jgi:hypothetical protein
MSVELLSLVIAGCAIVITASVVAISIALWRLAADARTTAARTDSLLELLDAELPPTLAAVRSTARQLDELAGESTQRIALLEQLAAEGSETMIAVRELSSSVNEILRGPADTVTGVRRSARMVGSGIASGADRLRRAIAGETGPDEPEP